MEDHQVAEQRDKDYINKFINMNNAFNLLVIKGNED